MTDTNNTVKTPTQIKHYATQFARDHYYLDHTTREPWMRYAHWDTATIDENVTQLAQQVEHAMLWAVGQASAADQT